MIWHQSCHCRSLKLSWSHFAWGKKKLLQTSFILHPASLCIFWFRQRLVSTKAQVWSFSSWCDFCVVDFAIVPLAWGLFCIFPPQQFKFSPFKCKAYFVNPVVQVLHIIKGSTLFWISLKFLFTNYSTVEYN